jgi:ADP-heptose:LPS heptosyltransferase
VAAPERWDEACFAVPALRAALASGMSVGVLCREDQQDFWQTVAGLEVVAVAPKTKAKVAAAMIRGCWQAALLWEPGLAAEIVNLAAVPRRLGPADRNLNKRLTHPLQSAEQPMAHRVRFYLSAVEQIGIHTDRTEFFAPVDLGIVPLSGVVLLSPDSDFGPSHQWLLDRWLEIATRLIQGGQQVVVAGVTGSRGMAAALAHELGESGAYCDASVLSAVLPTLAAYRRVVAADGSLPHLAAHVGATCVTLFGPNDPVWKRPLGRRHAVVRRHVECTPCLRAKCPLDGRCQHELATDRVWAAVLGKLMGTLHEVESSVSSPGYGTGP